MAGLIIIYFFNNEECSFVFSESTIVCEAIKAFKRENKDIIGLLENIKVYDSNGNYIMSIKNLKCNHKGG